jgi:hypothetical protein
MQRQTEDQLVPESVPDNVTFESLVAESELLNSAGGTFKFCAAVRLFHQNSLPSCRVPGIISRKAKDSRSNR